MMFTYSFNIFNQIYYRTDSFLTTKNILIGQKGERTREKRNKKCYYIVE